MVRGFNHRLHNLHARGTHRDWHDLYRQSISPIVFVAHQLLSILIRLPISLLIERARKRVEDAQANANMHARILHDIPNPLSLMSMLGEHVKLAF